MTPGALVVMLGLALGWAGPVTTLPRVAGRNTSWSLSWQEIEAKRGLEWESCSDGLQCARLKLPLDWTHPKADQRTVAMAVIKLLAAVPDTDPSFGGPIVVNPGGSGGSGIDMVLAYGSRLRSLVDRPGRRHYELVGFDPRSVGMTTPQADCFPEDGNMRSAVLLMSNGIGPLTASRAAVPQMLSMFKVMADSCLQAANSHIFGFMSTASVARDMLELIDKMAEARRPANSIDPVARLKYLGVSYGTVLGNYFASMFPGRVGRMLLDGVVDADEWANGQAFTKSVTDIDDMVDHFFAGCHDAGEKACPLASLVKGASSRVLRQAFENWLDDIDEETMIMNKGPGMMPHFIMSHHVRMWFISALYGPRKLFRSFSQMLFNMIKKGQGARLEADVMSDLLSRDGLGIPLAHGDGSEAFLGVLCSDGINFTGRSTRWWRDNAALQAASSAVMGNKISRIQCSAWPFVSNYVFRGPFTTPEARRGRPGRPDAPLLFVSTQFDPITPVGSARMMASQHPGAGLVIVKIMGHSTITNAADSECLGGILAEYFDSGSVPARETLCDVAGQP